VSGILPKNNRQLSKIWVRIEHVLATLSIGDILGSAPVSGVVIGWVVAVLVRRWAVVKKCHLFYQTDTKFVVRNSCRFNSAVDSAQMVW